VGYATLLRQKSQKPISISELQLNFQKHIKICYIDNEKYILLQENFFLTINFDLMINFDFFDLITVEWLIVSA